MTSPSQSSLDLIKKRIKIIRNAIINLSEAIELLEETNDQKRYDLLQKNIEEMTTHYLSLISKLIQQVNELHG